MKATYTWGSPLRDGEQGGGSNIILIGNEVYMKNFQFLHKNVRRSGKNAVDHFLHLSWFQTYTVSAFKEM